MFKSPQFFNQLHSSDTLTVSASGSCALKADSNAAAFNDVPPNLESDNKPNISESTDRLERIRVFL